VYLDMLLPARHGVDDPVVPLRVCLSFTDCGVFHRTYLVLDVHNELHCVRHILDMLLLCVSLNFVDCGELQLAHHGLDIRDALHLA
jgi:hypothetical protein